jgi:opacity protein-like surface antigen
MKSRVALCLLTAFLILGPTIAAFASPAPDEEEQAQPRFRVGFFWEGYQLNDKNLINFYGHFQKNLPGFEASVHTLYNFDVWAAYRAYTDEAKTSYSNLVDKFRLDMFSLGAIYRLSTGLIEPFVGAGFEIYSYSEKIEGETDLQGASGSTVGVHIQIGTYINITKFLAAKVYARFNNAGKTLAGSHPDDTARLDLGSKEFGLSLMARF